MAIIFLFNVMVVRKSEIGTKYPGGLTQFRTDWMGRSKRWREDEHLLACTSMGFDFKDIVERLNALGVELLVTDESVPPQENVKRCSWIDWDIYERLEIKSPDGQVRIHEVPRHWLKGSEPGETADFRPPK